MTPWSRGILYGLDTETSGVNVLEDRIVTATVVKVGGGATGPEKPTRTWLIAVDVDIPEEATKVHGITTEQARADGRPAAEALEEIADTVAGILNAGYPLIVFNAAFDLSLLEAELRRHQLPSLYDRVKVGELRPGWNTVIDPNVIARGITKELAQSGDRAQWANLKAGMMKLPALCKRFGVPFTESHDATADATGAVLLARALVDTYNVLGTLTASELHARQAAWHQVAQAGLREWAAKQGKSEQYADVDEGWPLHSSLRPLAVSSTSTFKKPEKAT